MKPLVSIVDDALPAAQFTKLRRAVTALGLERIRSTYQTTFWHQLGTTPTNLVELAAERLKPRGVRALGVEWWLSRMRTSNVKVDFHVDRDNARFDETGELAHPTLSSLLYLTTSVGGLLAVTREPVDPKGPACAPKKRDFDLVEPKPNRFVFFDGTLTHGVLDARNEVPLARLKPTPWRIAIAINFWRERPWRVPGFAEASVYRRLALSRAGL